MKSNLKSSKVKRSWINQHMNDSFVRLAKKDGYRARSVYKLQEIDQSLHLLQAGQLVVDLGCAPGAWCQYVRDRLKPKPRPGSSSPGGNNNARIIGLDLLPMTPIEGVVFIRGDIREPSVQAELGRQLQGRLADVVLCDMAPNLSGIEATDAARIEQLVELALAFSQQHLKPSGALVAKVFHGASYDALAQRFRASFVRFKCIKPKASRSNSCETFLIGIGQLPAHLHVPAKDDSPPALVAAN